MRYKADYETQLEALQAYEAELRENTVYDIQAWWASTIAWRKAIKQHQRVQKSLYYYRIRRLAKLKKAIDKFNPVKVTMNALEDAFCDVIPELREYRLYKKAKATKIATRWGFKLLAKARAKLTSGLWKVRVISILSVYVRAESDCFSLLFSVYITHSKTYLSMRLLSLLYYSNKG